MAHLERIAVIGTGGRVGGAFADELLKTGKHTVTAISRQGSKSDIPAGIKAIYVDYDNEESLVTALKGQQVLVITLATSAPRDLHGKIVRAAGKAGVPYIIPNAYGADIRNSAVFDKDSGDLYTSSALAKCEEVNDAGSSFICFVCGFWLEWSLACGEDCFGFDIKNRKVIFFDDGTAKMNVSTWNQCGRAMGALLSLPASGASPSVEDWKNKPLYFDSFCVSQRDMLDSLNRVMGTTDKDWTITHEASKERYQKARAALQKGDFSGFVKAMYTRLFYPSEDGNFGARNSLVNKTLGLPEESFDEAVKRAVDMVESGWTR